MSAEAVAVRVGKRNYRAWLDLGWELQQGWPEQHRLLRASIFKFKLIDACLDEGGNKLRCVLFGRCKKNVYKDYIGELQGTSAADSRLTRAEVYVAEWNEM